MEIDTKKETEEISPPPLLVEVDILKISVSPYQPRRTFGRDELEELADSIKELGLLQPPVVRWLADKESYELISGERRFRAAYLAGLQKIPVIVKNGGELFSAQAAIVENIQRVDLNPMEIARALKDIRKFGQNLDEIAKTLGKKRSTISNYLRLLELPKEIQLSLEKGEISMGHAKAILSAINEEEMKLLLKEILQEKLSVRDVEERVSSAPRTKKRTKNSPDVHRDDLLSKIQERLGTKVSLVGNKLMIDFYGDEDLTRIAELMGIVL